MPIYEYKCPDSHVTERLELTSKNESAIVCPQCSQIAMKIISRGSWQFAEINKFGSIRTYTP